MSGLYLAEQGSLVGKTDERRIFEKDDWVLAESQRLKLETILIGGNVQITMRALAELLDYGTELALLSLREAARPAHAAPRAREGGGEAGSVLRRGRLEALG